jgi:hypothetical protein
MKRRPGLQLVGIATSLRRVSNGYFVRCEVNDEDCTWVQISDNTPYDDNGFYL